MKYLTASLAAALVLAAGFLAWGNHQRTGLQEKLSKAVATTVSLAFEVSEAKMRQDVITQFVDRVQVIHQQGATITREIPVYVTPKVDSDYLVPGGFVRLHDAAAQGVLPGPARSTDAAPAGIALSAVAGTVVDNYTRCRAVTEQLMALQDFDRKRAVVPP